MGLSFELFFEEQNVRFTATGLLQPHLLIYCRLGIAPALSVGESNPLPGMYVRSICYDITAHLQ